MKKLARRDLPLYVSYDMVKRVSSLLLACFLLCAPFVVVAQTATPSPTPTVAEDLIPFIHTVQQGENLTYIAGLYEVTVADLLTANQLGEEAVLLVGQELVIPGREGEAVTTTYSADIGDTLAGVAAKFNTSVPALLDANHLIHPYYELTVGEQITVVSRTGSVQPRPLQGQPHVVAAGESLLEIAARYNVALVELAALNDLNYPFYLYPGQRLRVPGDGVYRELPGEWIDIAIRPLPLRPGQTLSIYVENLLKGRPNGRLAGQALRFVPQDDGFVALVGLDASTQPGHYTLELGGSGTRPWTPFRQNVPVEPVAYGTQAIVVPEELSPLLAPEVRAEEDAFLSTIYTRFDDNQRWQGLFQYPVTTTVVTAPYGDGRSYNGGPVEIFHTGVDFAGQVGTPILAPANGEIVYTGTLKLRGQTVIINHGLGVMSAYFHLSEILVDVGDAVAVGDPIAASGSTGLSTGPHLHWDLRVMDVPVNPLPWTQVSFP